MKKNLAAVCALLFKIVPKAFGLLAKFGKALQIGKVALAGTALASYAYLTTWQFGVVILLAVAFHEAGHVWAMRRYGMKTSGFYLLPFVGGVAVAEDKMPSRDADAYISLMGPIWGLALALVAVGCYLVTGWPFFAAVAGWMAMINLFNLLPVYPLDGGRVMRSILCSLHSTSALIYAAICIQLLVLAAAWLGLGLFVFLAMVSAMELGVELWGASYRRGNRQREEGRIEEYHWKPLERLLGTANVEIIKSTVDDPRAIGLLGSFDVAIAILLERRAKPSDLKLILYDGREIAFVRPPMNDVVTDECVDLGDAPIPSASDSAVQLTQHVALGDGQDVVRRPQPVTSYYLGHLPPVALLVHDNMPRYAPVEAPEPPAMTWSGIVYAALGYALVGAALYAILASMSHVPGADVAFEILKG